MVHICNYFLAFENVIPEQTKIITTKQTTEKFGVSQKLSGEELHTGAYIDRRPTQSLQSRMVKCMPPNFQYLTYFASLLYPFFEAYFFIW